MRGPQIVYCSPMTHGPFSSLRSISSKHSVMVAHTLRFIPSLVAGARYAGTRHPDSPAIGAFLETRRKWVWIRTRGRPPSLSHNRATMLGRGALCLRFLLGRRLSFLVAPHKGASRLCRSCEQNEKDG